ncbi:hypothetical protein ES288_A05G462200v1 [Gossypium darwinii]|uniref:Uncharacterized protein n=1 Tax=Gossypium darwinii TaxID=34276 RepID=A0A5D2GUE4_GOSDA|nr:hypothetical protein ES288_A05G462200v1 [Gossypium darwinii]
MPFAEPIEHRWPPWMAYEEPSIYSIFFLPLPYRRISRYFIFLFNLNISFYVPPPQPTPAPFDLMLIQSIAFLPEIFQRICPIHVVNGSKK